MTELPLTGDINKAVMLEKYRSNTSEDHEEV